MAASHFTPDPDWVAYAEAHELPIGTLTPSNNRDITPMEMPFEIIREYQAEDDAARAALRPLESYSYESHTFSIPVKDSNDSEVGISVKLSAPTAARLQSHPTKALPVVFITHGGGLVAGTHASEEAWLLQPLFPSLDFIISSVEYRLAPEHKYPTYLNDAWQVLQHLFDHPTTFTSNLSATADLNHLILAGSSAGGAIAATLAQRCRDITNLHPITGVILNVPMLCHYRHFPGSENESQSSGISQSYIDCNDDVLGSSALAGCWDAAVPTSVSGSDPGVSPLLGSLHALPPHAIFIAGRDPLHDDGKLYAQRLRDSGIDVSLFEYAGVPHQFAHYPELKSTQRFGVDLVESLRKWIA